MLQNITVNLNTKVSIETFFFEVRTKILKFWIRKLLRSLSHYKFSDSIWKFSGTCVLSSIKGKANNINSGSIILCPGIVEQKNSGIFLKMLREKWFWGFQLQTLNEVMKLWVSHNQSLTLKVMTQTNICVVNLSLPHSCLLSLLQWPVTFPKNARSPIHPSSSSSSVLLFFFSMNNLISLNNQKTILKHICDPSTSHECINYFTMFAVCFSQ